jgi:hypothetical protein
MVQAPRPLRNQPVADMEEELAKGGTCAGEDKEEHGEGGDYGYGSKSPATVQRSLERCWVFT